MMKKSLIFVAALVGSFATAQVASAQTSPFNGFYVGGQVGYSYIDVEVSVDDLGSADDNLDGFGGGGFIGFGWVSNQVYGGFEAEVGYDGADWSESFDGTTVDLEAQLTYGLSGRVGGVIADKFLIYGRAGWVRTNFELSASGLGSDDEFFDGFGEGVEDGPVEVGPPAFARRHASHDVGAVLDHLLGVEGAFLARKALYHQARLAIDENAHSFVRC